MFSGRLRPFKGRQQQTLLGTPGVRFKPNNVQGILDS